MAGTQFSATLSPTNLGGVPAYNRQSLQNYYQSVGLGPGGALVSQGPRQAIDMQLVRQQGNDLQARLMQGAQAQGQRLQASLAGRGFGSNSPAGIFGAANLEALARGQGASAVLQNRLQALQANNQLASQWDQERRQNELQRMQMALSLLGQDQSLYGTQLGYLSDQQRLAAEQQMQQADLANRLQVAQIQNQGRGYLTGADFRGPSGESIFGYRVRPGLF